MYHQLHHGGRLLFHGFCDFYELEQENANKNANGKKNGKNGAFSEPVTRISERPFFRQFEL